MGSNALGFGAAIAFLVIMAFWSSPDNPMHYVEAHGLFTVVIGTTIVTVISVPWIEAKMFFKMIKVVMRKEVDDRVDIVNQFVEMAAKARIDMSALAPYVDSTKDPFFKDSISLLVQGMDVDSMMRILRRRLEVQKERENSQAKMFKNLGKYPPACGLMGTVFGMIALLGALGQEGAGDKIGPAMSVALAATLYGVIVANLVILPVADNLMSRTQKSIAKREMIVEGIVYLKQKTNPIMLREMLLSHLPPAMREKVTGAGGGGKAQQGAA
jgi:chemotaxis protein MotA